MNTIFERDSILKIILIGFLVVLLMAVIVLCCVPPISRDALAHHLAVPKLYLKHGGIYEIPDMLFSYYPMNMELLYLIPLSFGNDIIPKFIHFLCALLTAWLLFHYIRRRLNTIYALLGAVFFLSVPIIVKLSITVYVDLGLVFFSTASLLLFLRWMESGFHIRFLILSAVMCGLALGTKYNGLILFLLLTLFVPFFYSRYAGRGPGRVLKGLGKGALFMGIALLVYSPWMIRNYIWTNNPVFPLYDRVFNPHNPLVRESVSHFTYRHEIYGESWLQIALLPIRIFFQGQDDNAQLFDGMLNPFLLFLPLFAFFLMKRDSKHVRREKKILLAFSVLFFAFAFLTRDLRIRYLLPILPPLVLLSIFGARRICEVISDASSVMTRKIGYILIVLVISFALFLNAFYVVGQHTFVSPLKYIRGDVTREAYIGQYCSEYPIVRFINTNLPQDARLLFFFMGKRGYYCNREYIFDIKDYKGTFSIFRDAVEKSSNSKDLYTQLQNLGITHFLANRSLFGWLKDKDNFEEETIPILQTFFREHLELLYELDENNKPDESDYFLYRLKDASN